MSEDKGFCVVVAGGPIGSVSRAMSRGAADRYAAALGSTGEAGLIFIVDHDIGSALRRELAGQLREVTPPIEAWEEVRVTAQIVAQLALAVVHAAGRKDAEAVCDDLKTLLATAASITRFCALSGPRREGQ